MNNVILTGRLCRDVEIKRTQNGKAVTQFTLAVDRIGDGADFVSCVAWEKVAENMARFLGKGSKVLVDGKLQVRSWEKDGQKRTVTEVVARQVEFLDKRGETKDEPEVEYHEVTGDDDALPF